MRFLSLIRIDETNARPPDEPLLAKMGELMEAMTREGVLIETAGLMPSANGRRLRLRGGRIAATDGPFAESKEVIGGLIRSARPRRRDGTDASLPRSPRRRLGSGMRSAAADARQRLRLSLPRAL